MITDGLRILLVDDHAVVRQGYRRLIEKHAGMAVVGEASDAASGYQAFKACQPDVTVVDISMPGRGGIELIRQIRQRDAQAGILVFTMHAAAVYAHQAFRAGALGYVTKSSPPDTLIEAIRTVAAGRPALCPEISHAVAAGSLRAPEAATAVLSPREFSILRQILAAKTTDEIAMAFNLSPKTVANYHYEIKSKLGVRSDIELVYLCMQQGLIDDGAVSVD